MIGKYLHPNTRAMLQAWQKLSARTGTDDVSDPLVADHRGMIGLLFVLQREDVSTWTFRSAGAEMERLIGRDLVGQAFSSLWSGADRVMVTGLLAAIEDAGRPGIVRGRGETLTGKRLELEIPLAPLEAGSGGLRVLGLYQGLGAQGILGGRPIWRHRVSLVSAPSTPVEPPRLRLVADNTSAHA
jgi:hypothetical protein